jgi:hypothetical protein
MYSCDRRNLFSFPEFSENSKCTIYIYDLLGNEVLTKKLINSLEEIDVSRLNSGVYFIKVQSDLNSFTKKFLKS